MIIRLVIVVFVVFASGCNLSKRSDFLKIRGGIDVGYSGKYAGHPEIQKLFQEFPAMKRWALEEIRLRTGLEPIDDSGIVVQLRDKTRQDRDSLAWIKPMLLGRKLVQYIVIYAQTFVIAPEMFKSVLTHEVVHAIMNQRMSRKRFAALPTWVKEGAATWAAGEIPMMLSWYVCGRVAEQGKLIDGLERPVFESWAHTPKDYLEDALFFEFLAQEYGLAVVKDCFSGITSGTDYELVFERATGRPMGALRESFDLFAKKTIAENPCPKALKPRANPR